MAIKNITVTSKNQITLPMEYVRSMHIEQNRVLQAELRGETIILTPQPALSDTMRQFWGKHKAKRALSDDELNHAVRDGAIERLHKNI